MKHPGPGRSPGCCPSRAPNKDAQDDRREQRGLAVTALVEEVADGDRHQDAATEDLNATWGCAPGFGVQTGVSLAWTP